jgi:hypothetical protein
MSLCSTLLLLPVFLRDTMEALGKMALHLIGAIPMVNGTLASLASWLFHSMPLLWLRLGPSHRLPLPMSAQVIRLVMGLLGFASSRGDKTGSLI